MEASEKEPSADDLLSTIRDCCSQTPEFITYKLPIMESIFRLLLANNNEALELEELVKQMNERRSAYAYPVSPIALSRLLSSDQCYGLRHVQSNPS